MDFRNLYMIPRAVVRLCFILINNAYCIPTYVVWMVLLSPLRRVNPDVYWKIEGYFFHWLLAMVSMWSCSAGYQGKYRQKLHDFNIEVVVKIIVF